jgi:hypothetical protein
LQEKISGKTLSNDSFIKKTLKYHSPHKILADRDDAPSLPRHIVANNPLPELSEYDFLIS